MSGRALTVLAIDPGRSKCGLAVVRATTDGAVRRTDVLHREVVASGPGLISAVAAQTSRFSIDAMILGNGTTSSETAKLIDDAQDIPVVVVDEQFTTLEARKRYFEENPPRGLRRIIPVSLQPPPRPYDDYVAVILAERYLAAAEA